MYVAVQFIVLLCESLCEVIPGLEFKNERWKHDTIVFACFIFIYLRV